LDRKLDGPQDRSGRGGEEKNSQPLPRLEPPIIQPVAQLSQFLFENSVCGREYLDKRRRKWQEAGEN